MMMIFRQYSAIFPDVRAHEFNSVHPLSSNLVSEPPKGQLAAKGSDTVRHLDTEVLIRSVATSSVKHVAYHRSTDRDGKNIIGVCEETNSGHKAGFDVKPLESARREGGTH